MHGLPVAVWLPFTTQRQLEIELQCTYTYFNPPKVHSECACDEQDEDVGKLSFCNIKPGAV